jgi:hypothetical protein
VVALRGISDTESNNDLIYKRWVRQLHTHRAEVFRDMKGQRVATALKSASLEKRLTATTVLVRSTLRQGRTSAFYVHVYTHTSRRNPRRKVQNVCGELAHDAVA